MSKTAYEQRKEAYEAQLVQDIAAVEQEATELVDSYDGGDGQENVNFTTLEEWVEKKRELAVLRGDAVSAPIEQDHLGVAWIPEEENTPLKSLVSVLDSSSADINYSRGTPWREGYRLNIVGQGGLYDREDHLLTTVRGSYSNDVQGNIDATIGGDYQFNSNGIVNYTFALDSTVTDANPAEETEEEIDDTGDTKTSSIVGPPLTNHLEVEGKGTYYCHTNTITGQGVVLNRVWEGAHSSFLRE